MSVRSPATGEAAHRADAYPIVDRRSRPLNPATCTCGRRLRPGGSALLSSPPQCLTETRPGSLLCCHQLPPQLRLVKRVPEGQKVAHDLWGTRPSGGDRGDSSGAKEVRPAGSGGAAAPPPGSLPDSLGVGALMSRSEGKTEALRVK